MKPTRIRLSRKKGFNLQETSRKFNGLGAVKVDRTNRLWGNPFVVGKHGTIDECLKLYQEYMLSVGVEYPDKFKEEIRKLYDKNLACWCPNNAKCHGDFLLEVIEQSKIIGI